MHGAVVAWRSQGSLDRCTSYHQPDSLYFGYTFPYQASDLHGYCWTGAILRKEAYHDLAEQKKRGGQEQLATAIVQKLLRPSWIDTPQLTVHDVIFDQTHAPHAGIFDVPMMSTDEPFALQVSSGGVHMALLLAGDAAITPWFPRSIGLNLGAKRAVEPFIEQRLGPDGNARTEDQHLEDSAEAKRQLALGWEQLPKADSEVRFLEDTDAEWLNGNGFTKKGLRAELHKHHVHHEDAVFNKLWRLFPILTGEVRKTECCWETLEKAAQRVLKKNWMQLKPVPAPNAAGLLLRCIRPETRGLKMCKTDLPRLRSDLLHAIDGQMRLQVEDIKSLLSRCAPQSPTAFLPITTIVVGLITVITRG